MSRDYLIDLAAWIAMGFWFGVSTGFFIREIQSGFLAMGGVATIIGVTYFIVQRHGTPQLDADIKMSMHNSDHVAMLGNQVHMHGALISLLSKELLEELRRQNRKLPDYLKFLANNSVDEATRFNAREQTASSERSLKIEKNRLMANQAVVRARRNSELLQAGLVIVGTAQTSFGGFLFMLG